MTDAPRNAAHPQGVEAPVLADLQRSGDAAIDRQQQGISRTNGTTPRSQLQGRRLGYVAVTAPHRFSSVPMPPARLQFSVDVALLQKG